MTMVEMEKHKSDTTTYDDAIDLDASHIKPNCRYYFKYLGYTISISARSVLTDIAIFDFDDNRVDEDGYTMSIEAALQYINREINGMDHTEEKLYAILDRPI